jgi:hypothetical protein
MGTITLARAHYVKCEVQQTFPSFYVALSHSGITMRSAGFDSASSSEEPPLILPKIGTYRIFLDMAV